MKTFKQEYDFIVIGSGSGGSVVANRLSENSNWTVLLLEAGPEEIILDEIPLFVSHIVNSDFNWGYRTERSDSICQGMKDQRCNWPRGKVMGGTSVTNYMVYSRGVPHDYDDWAALGNTGWSFKDVLSYFKKSEDIQSVDLKNSPYHGVGGPLKIERPKWRSHLAASFMEAGHEMGYNTVDPSEQYPVGFSHVLANTGSGERFSASKAFLRPIRKRSNFKVSKRSRVTKILIDTNSIPRKAIGVEFYKKQRKHVVRASKEVILCAGALNSPQILMLSGIGPRDHLEELKIPVIEDLKVGHNLQDHVSMAGLVFLVNSSDTIVEKEFQRPRYMLDYLLRREGPYTSPGGAETMALVASKFEKDKTRPDIELVMGPGALTGDSGGSLKSLLGLSDEFFNKVYRPYFEHHAYNIVPLILRPYSRGLVKLRSNNPFDSPKFYANYLSDTRDLDVLIESIKMVSFSFVLLFLLFLENSKHV
ncbi:hypothetical protein WDU94_012989 [Cyamophila willieti]